MKIEVFTKNYDMGDKLQGLIDKKVEKLSKYLGVNSKVKVFCKSEKELCTMEITVFADKDVLRAEVASNNMYDNLDDVLRKIERQLVKRNKKMDLKHKKGTTRDSMELLFNTEIPDEEPSKLVRVKKFEMKPMSVEDAIAALEMLDHNFYVFQNADTMQISVLYKRNDGDIGLIEPAL